MRSLASSTALSAAAVPYLLLEAAYATLASFGRDPFLDVVAPRFAGFALLQGGLLVGLAAACTGSVFEVRRARASGAVDDATALHALSLAIAVGYVASRFGASPLGAAARGLDAFGAYGTMAVEFDTRPYVAVAALGIPFASLHVFLGLRRGLARWLGVRRALAVAGAVSTLVLFSLVDATAWFAIGRTFLPR